MFNDLLKNLYDTDKILNLADYKNKTLLSDEKIKNLYSLTKKRIERLNRLTNKYQDYRNLILFSLFLSQFLKEINLIDLDLAHRKLIKDHLDSGAKIVQKSKNENNKHDLIDLENIKEYLSMMNKRQFDFYIKNQNKITFDFFLKMLNELKSTNKKKFYLDPIQPEVFQKLIEKYNLTNSSLGERISKLIYNIDNGFNHFFISHNLVTADFEYLNFNVLISNVFDFENSYKNIKESLEQFKYEIKIGMNQAFLLVHLNLFFLRNTNFRTAMSYYFGQYVKLISQEKNYPKEKKASKEYLDFKLKLKKYETDYKKLLKDLDKIIDDMEKIYNLFNLDDLAFQYSNFANSLYKEILKKV